MARRHASRLIPGLAFAAMAAAVLPASAAALPCQVPETDRHHVVRINLDGTSAKELVDVFNFDAAATPVTELMVCKSVNGALRRSSLRVVWGPSPGNRQSGLRAAWVGNLDRSDGRIEVAARNSITASAGENLVILRQSRTHGLTFSRLQTIEADTVTMARPSGRPAFVTAFVKATHSIDGKAHSERWTYRAARGRWVCSADCLGRPVAARAIAGRPARPAAAARPTINVSPSTARAGTTVRVYGTVPGCGRGGQVTLISRAFAHVHDFAGLPAVFATVGSRSAYSVHTRIPASRSAGRYSITGRCGGGNLGVIARLRVLAASTTRACGDVVVRFGPEASGGAHGIRATNVSCTTARTVSRRCVAGRRTAGWSYRTVRGRYIITSGRRRITYIAVAGGGCL